MNHRRDDIQFRDRRRLVGLLGGAALAPLAVAGVPLPPWPMRALASPPTTHRIAVGSFEITVVSDGDVTLPLDFLLPGRSRDEISALYLANGGNLPANAAALRGEVNVTVVKTPDATIVIDCGGGTDFMPTTGRYATNLEAAGITADSVTHVVFTHAHADHFWGVIDPFDDASRFQKARHVMPAAELEYWRRPNIANEVPDAMRGMALGIVRRLDGLRERIEAVKPGAEIVPGVALVDTAGHTPGHVSVAISSGAEQILVGGDVLTNPFVSFAKPDWTWGPDVEPDRAAAARKRTLDMLATDRIRLLGYHLPWPGIGRVERNHSGYRFVQS